MSDVSYQHPDYITALPKWTKCRTVVEGEEAVHAACETYLKKLAAETDDNYEIRLSNATFYDVTCRTVEGMQGMLFRKPFSVEPEELADNDLLTNIDSQGHDLAEFLKILSFEASVVNRFGLLTDHSSVGEGATVADVKKAGARPHVLLYKAESIINWRYNVVDGKRKLSLVVLTETSEEYKDEWESERPEQYRVLDLDEGRYRVRIFRKTADGGKEFEQIGDDIYPKLKGQYFDHIPFDFYPDIDIKKPMILGLVNMNLSHYRTTALHEQCLYRMPPTLTVSGWTPKEGTSFYMGGVTAQCFPDPETKASILEPSGNLKAITDALEAKERRLNILGVGLFSEDKKQVEAAQTASIRKMGNVSTLAALSIELSTLITTAINRMLAWGGVTQEMNISLNRDFNPMEMSPQMLTSMLASVQAGKMSFQTWFDNLQKGEIVSENVTAEEEQERIDSQQVSVPGFNQGDE